MLVLKRKEGQWIEATHRSGDILRFRLYNFRTDPPSCNLAFDDPARNFAIERPERFLAGDQVAERFAITVRSTDDGTPAMNALPNHPIAP